MEKKMKMHVLYNGDLYLDLNSLVAGRVQASASSPATPCEWVRIPVSAYLIEHPDGLILYDTGCDPLGMSENWTEKHREYSPHVPVENGSIVERLAQLGYTPDDVTYVVISHLHTDHAGALALFKKAQVYVSDNEFTMVARMRLLGEMNPAYSASDIDPFFSAGLNWQLIGKEETEVRLLDGLTILNLGSGHTFGMLSLHVELPNSGSFLLVADAIYTKENAGPPVRKPGILYDSLGYIASAERLVNYAAAHNAQILYGHDAEQIKELVLAPDGYYD